MISIFDDRSPIAVRVAYGTSQRVDRLRAGEFSITRADADDFEAAGLSLDTKFDLGATVVLIYAELAFPCAPARKGTPVLGRLTKRAELRALRAYEELHAR